MALPAKKAKTRGRNSSIQVRSTVVALKQAGLSYVEIERQTGKGKKFVQYWVKRTETATGSTKSFQDASTISHTCRDEFRPLVLAFGPS